MGLRLNTPIECPILTNNFYKTNQYHKYGLNKTGSTQVISANDSFDVDGTLGHSFGFAANNCTSCNGSSNLIFRPNFLLQSAATTYARGVYLYVSSMGLEVNGAVISPTFQNGSLFESDDSGGGYTKSVFIKNSYVKTVSGLANSNRYPIHSLGKINLTVKDSIIDTDLGSQAAIRVTSTVLYDINLMVDNSKLIMRRDSNAIAVPSSQWQNLTTINTDFIRAGFSGTSLSAVSGGAHHIWNSSGSQADGTRFCAESGSIQFGSVASGFTPQGYAGWGGIPVNGPLDLATMACQ